MSFYPSQFQDVGKILSQLISTYTESHPNYHSDEHGALLALRKTVEEIDNIIKTPEKCTLKQYKELININIQAAMPPSQIIIEVSRGFLGLCTSNLTLISDLYILLRGFIEIQNKIISSLEEQENIRYEQEQQFSAERATNGKPIFKVEAAIEKLTLAICDAIGSVKEETKIEIDKIKESEMFIREYKLRGLAV